MLTKSYYLFSAAWHDLVQGVATGSQQAKATISGPVTILIVTLIYYQHPGGQCGTQTHHRKGHVLPHRKWTPPGAETKRHGSNSYHLQATKHFSYRIHTTGKALCCQCFIFHFPASVWSSEATLKVPCHTWLFYILLCLLRFHFQLLLSELHTLWQTFCFAILNVQQTMQFLEYCQWSSILELKIIYIQNIIYTIER